MSPAVGSDPRHHYRLIDPCHEPIFPTPSFNFPIGWTTGISGSFTDPESRVLHGADSKYFVMLK